jgi:hypothetical protein
MRLPEHPFDIRHLRDAPSPHTDTPVSNNTPPSPPGRPGTARPLPVPPQAWGATDAFSLIRTRAESARSGSQTGSQQPQPPGDPRLQPAHIRAVRWLIERRQAIHRDAPTVPSKQRVVSWTRARGFGRLDARISALRNRVLAATIDVALAAKLVGEPDLASGQRARMSLEWTPRSPSGAEAKRQLWRHDGRTSGGHWKSGDRTRPSP